MQAEPAWSHLKRSLANLAGRNLGQLAALTRTRLRPIQYHPRNAILDATLTC